MSKIQRLILDRAFTAFLGSTTDVWKEDLRHELHFLNKDQLETVADFCEQVVPVVTQVHVDQGRS